MKEIKFKVWDKKYKRMISMQLTLSDIAKEEELVLPYHTENYEFLLYTGVKDKNEKDIYEFDILKIKLKNKEFIGVVEYHKGCYFVGGMPLYMIESEEMEIVENYFENQKPDLLLYIR
jgi:uncharacterized phage protein (TIGR01671 family)